MPQPLNRVLPHATFKENANALFDKPELAKIVSSIFANSALIEQRLSLLLVRLLGADAAPSFAIFDTLTAQHVQLRALRAAAEAALAPHELRVFKAALSVAESVQTPRNHLAHWTWGTCVELPNALLLAEPKAQKERDREIAMALERSETGKLNFAQMITLLTYDTSTIQVYKGDDLTRAANDLAGAAYISFLLCVYLDGIFRGRRSITDTAGSIPSLREQVFEQLSAQRLFREALDRFDS